MALIKEDIIINSFLGDIQFKNVYIKVDTIIGTKDILEVKVDIFNSDRIALLNTKYFTFNPNMDDNFIKQTYEYIKNLEEFEDARDC